MESVLVSSQKRECDTNSLHSDESKLRLKDAIVYLEQLLLKNDLVARVSSGTISHEAIQIGKSLYESIIEILGNKTFVRTEELIMQESDDERNVTNFTKYKMMNRMKNKVILTNIY